MYGTFVNNKISLRAGFMFKITKLATYSVRKTTVVTLDKQIKKANWKNNSPDVVTYSYARRRDRALQ